MQEEWRTEGKCFLILAHGWKTFAFYHLHSCHNVPSAAQTFGAALEEEEEEEELVELAGGFDVEPYAI